VNERNQTQLASQIMQISVPNQIPLTRHIPASSLGLLLSLSLILPKTMFIVNGINALPAHAKTVQQAMVIHSIGTKTLI
jgi:hypothetical protein